MLMRKTEKAGGWRSWSGMKVTSAFEILTGQPDRRECRKGLPAAEEGAEEVEEA